MMKGFRTLLIASACLGLCASAGAFTVDGDWDDWFSYSAATYDAGGGGIGAPADGINEWVAPDVLAPNVVYYDGALRHTDGGQNDSVTPGAANNQIYDVEAILASLELNDPTDLSAGGTFYIGMVTGYNGMGAGTFGQGAPHFAGDMFVSFNTTPGVGGVPTWNYAIGTAVKNTVDYTADTYGAIENEDRLGELYGDGTTQASALTTVPVNVPAFAAANPWRVDGDSAVMTEAAWGGGNADGETMFNANTNAQVTGGDRHNFLEVCLELSEQELLAMLEEDQYGNYVWSGQTDLTIHWTMLCGNDWVTWGNGQPFSPQPGNPIPEPATVALLGLGVAALTFRKRFMA